MADELDVIFLEVAFVDEAPGAQPVERGQRRLVRWLRRQCPLPPRPVEEIEETRAQQCHDQNGRSPDTDRPPIERDLLGRFDVTDIGRVLLLCQQAGHANQDLVTLGVTQILPGVRYCTCGAGMR